MKIAMCAALIVAAPLVHADGDWKINAVMDLYYQAHAGGAPGSLVSRGLDTKLSQIALGSALVKLQRVPDARSKWGLTLQAGGGDSLDILSAMEPAGSVQYRAIHQAYVTWVGDGLRVDVGKFGSWVGYESSLPADNANYSRSFNWSLGQPAYHFGARAAVGFGGGEATLYLVQGWNEIEDSNADKTVGASYSKTIGGGTSVSVNYINGAEGRLTPAPRNAASFGGIGYSAPGKRSTQMVNGYLSHGFANGHQLAVDASYAWAPGGSWWGLAGYYTLPAFGGSITGRIEEFRDQDGLRAGSAVSLRSLTLTYARALLENLEGRLEFRHDMSSDDFFPSGSSLAKSRSTLTAALIVRF